MLHFYLKLLERIKQHRIVWMFAIFIISIFFVALVSWALGSDHTANPTPFVPLVALVPILIHYVKNHHRNSPGPKYYGFIALCVLLYLVSSILEWQVQPWFAEQGFLILVIPIYIRPSLLFGAIAIFLLALLYQRPVPRFIHFIAGYALPIYCLHLYIPGKHHVFNFLHGLSPFSKVPAEIVTLAYMVGGSILLAFFLRKIKPIRQFL